MSAAPPTAAAAATATATATAVVKAAPKFFATPPFFGHVEALFPPVKNAEQLKQLSLGPLCMMVLAALQLLKRKITGTNASKLWEDTWKFISKAEARDKLGRFVQYAIRAITGSLQYAAPDHPLNVWVPAMKEMQTTLAWARRTMRWGKFMPHVPKLAKAIENGDALEATTCVILITFIIQDHIYWLLKVGALKFQSYTPVQWHRRNLRLITVNHVLNFILCGRTIKRIRDKQAEGDSKYSGSKEAVAKADKEVYDNKKQMFRLVLTFIQMLHVAQIKKMDDWYIGIMGMMSSYLDAAKQWPGN